MDAQLPARLSQFLNEMGHDAVHTSELPGGNRTTDSGLTEIADEQGRVVVTKDRDFRDGHLLSGLPRQLLIVATGNISNAELLALFETNCIAIVAALEEADFVELDRDALVVHGPRR